MTILRSSRLRCTLNGSDKEYTVQLLAEEQRGGGSRYTVRGLYGKTNKGQKETSPYYEGMSHGLAEAAFNQLEGAKILKGYLPFAGGVTSTPAVARPRVTSPSTTVEFFDDSLRRITI